MNPEERLSRTVTESPGTSLHFSKMWDPMKPAPPVTRDFFFSSVDVPPPNLRQHIKAKTFDCDDGPNRKGNIFTEKRHITATTGPHPLEARS